MIKVEFLKSISCLFYRYSSKYNLNWWLIQIQFHLKGIDENRYKHKVSHGIVYLGLKYGNPYMKAHEFKKKTMADCKI